MKNSISFLFLPLLFLFPFLTVCGEKKDRAIEAKEKLIQGETLLRKEGGSAHYRSLALDLFSSALPDLEEKEKYRAYFGIGTVHFLDLLHLLFWFLSHPPKEGSSPLPPPETLLAILNTLVDTTLRKGIVEPYRKVLSATSPGFVTFYFEKLSFPNPITSQGGPVDLKGEWDRTDLFLILGTIEWILGNWEFLNAYEGLLQGFLTLLLLPDPPPPPKTFPEIPAYWDRLLGKAFPQGSPFTSPSFLTLSHKERAERGYEDILTGTENLQNGIKNWKNEQDPQEDDLFPNTGILLFLVRRLGLAPLLGEEFPLEILETLIQPGDITSAVESFYYSHRDENRPFLLPQKAWELLSLSAEALTLPDSFPKDPVDLRFPAIRFVRLYSTPPTDLKKLLPVGEGGSLLAESEQEPFTDWNGNLTWDPGEPFEDKGVEGRVSPTEESRPGKGDGRWNDPPGVRSSSTLLPLFHKNPKGEWEPPNGVVNPLYLFFPDGSFGGVLLPYKKEEGGKFTANTETPFTNPDLNRFLSLLLWLVTILSPPS